VIGLVVLGLFFGVPFAVLAGLFIWICLTSEPDCFNVKTNVGAD
jgi:phage shock protein PspC (stress-responsive transcriptional regulator)